MQACEEGKKNTFYSSRDVIGAIIAYMKVNKFDGSTKTIQNVLFELKNHEDFKNYFDDLHFNKFLLYPYSKKLEKIIFRLNHSTVLKLSNPEYRIFEIDDEVKRNLKIITDEKFDKDAINDIIKMSDFFEQQTMINKDQCL